MKGMRKIQILRRIFGRALTLVSRVMFNQLT